MDLEGKPTLSLDTRKEDSGRAGSRVNAEVMFEKRRTNFLLPTMFLPRKG